MRRALVGIIAIIISIAAGIAFGAVLFRPVSPQGLGEAPPITDIPVAQRMIDDQRTVRLDLDLGPTASLKSSSTGLVTSLTCRSDEAITSGEHVMTLGDHKVYALATSTPLWRDLATGDKGDDVTGLQEELHRLGYSVAVDGQIGPRTLRAVADFVGLTDPAAIREYTTISRASFVWLPAPSVVPVSCSASPGDGINEHDELALLDRPLVRARVVDMPTDLLPGPRHLSIDGQSIPVTEEGIVDDPSALATLRSTPTYQRWLSSVKDDPAQALEASFGLVDPAPVSSVSPSVIYEVEGVHGCVLDHGVPRPVTIVSSELGQTHLVFPDGKPAPDSLPIPPKGSASCR